MDSPRIVEGEITARDRKVAIVAARFNDFIVSSLLKGATAAWLERGGSAGRSADRPRAGRLRAAGRRPQACR